MTGHQVFDYADSPYPVRDDIVEAHRWYWQQLAKPGSWWTGEERIAIAAELRQAPHCHFCQARKEALSPYAGDPAHSSVTDLSPLAVDAIHRVITDQSRIARHYVDANVEAGFSHEAYVELVGIVVSVLSIDEFNRALGLPPEPLPEPEAGLPDHYRPGTLETETGYVPMIPPEGATGLESDLWGDRTANVLRALSLVPDAVRGWVRLSAAQYLSIEGMANMIGQEDRAIDRAQMELVAGRVSSHNECFY